MEPIVYLDKYLDGNKIDEFKKLINFDDINCKYETSHFYNKNDNSVIVDRHIRSSEKVQFRNDQVFDWYELNVIDKLNSGDSKMHYILLRDDIEMIRYREGDFFKKHVDTINYYSNEFTSYTCIINIQSCESGGETIIHTTDGKHEFKQSNNVGSVLLFQKQLEHEGAMVTKGEKIITVCNIMVYPKEQYDDVLIVTIEKSNNVYFIPISTLEKFKGTVYYGFYNFEKIQDINKKIFRYTESVLNDAEFKIFYDILFPKKEKSNLVILDYIGVDKSDIYYDFNNFINDVAVDNQNAGMCDMFMCHMDDYYHLNKLINPKEITPFQLITFEYNSGGNEEYYYKEKKDQIVVWFGAHDNLFITCDFIRDKINYLSNIDEQYTLNDIKDISINNAKVFDIYEGAKTLTGKNLELLNRLVYKYNKFKKMSDITFSKSQDPFIGINKYIVGLMKDIESKQRTGDGYSEMNSSIIHEKLDPLYKLHDYEKICSNSCVEENDLNKYDYIKFMDTLKKTQLISDIKRSNTSVDLTCNSVQYTIYDVVYRFGFVKNRSLKMNK